LLLLLLLLLFEDADVTLRACLRFAETLSNGKEK